MSRASLTDLARVLLAGVDRRNLLRGIGATLAGAGFTQGDLAGDEASGKNKKKRRRRRRKRCRGSETKCGKKCVKGECCPGEPCGGECICVVAVEGDAYCAADVIVLCVECTASSDCDPGERCLDFGGDGPACCFPECGTV